jgi:hypothetical protein
VKTIPLYGYSDFWRRQCSHTFGARAWRTGVVRNGDEITSATMHHSFRPPLPDLKSQKHQNSLLFLQLL